MKTLIVMAGLALTPFVASSQTVTNSIFWEKGTNWIQVRSETITNLNVNPPKRYVKASDLGTIVSNRVAEVVDSTGKTNFVVLESQLTGETTYRTVPIILMNPMRLNNGRFEMAKNWWMPADEWLWEEVTGETKAN